LVGSIRNQGGKEKKVFSTSEDGEWFTGREKDVHFGDVTKRRCSSKRKISPESGKREGGRKQNGKNSFLISDTDQGEAAQEKQGHGRGKGSQQQLEAEGGAGPREWKTVLSLSGIGGSS